MSTSVQPLALDLELPWKANEEQEREFRNLLRKFLIPLLLLFIVIPWLPVFEPEYVAPERTVVKTKILLDKIEAKPVVLPKPIVAKPKLVKPKPKPPAKKPKAKQVPKSKFGKADKKKDIKSSQGLNQLSKQLSALRGSLDVSRMQKKNVTSSTGGSIKQSKRELLGQESAVRKSNGIKVNDGIMKNNSVALSKHKATTVNGLVQSDVPSAGQSSYSSYQDGQRDMESIRRTLEHAKNSVNTLYQRALRDNPNLAGKFTFKLIIEPSGVISGLSLLASELGIEDLEREILRKIKVINFGEKDVSTTSVEYKFVFLPS